MEQKDVTRLRLQRKMMAAAKEFRARNGQAKRLARRKPGKKRYK